MDKTLAAAKWLYDNNPEFSNLRTDESWQLMQSTMVMAKLFFMANGPAEFISAPMAVDKRGVCLPYLNEHRAELHTAPAAEFTEDELHSLKTVNRRFAYTAPRELARGLMAAKPFADNAEAARFACVTIADSEIPEDFLRSMRAIKQQFADSDFSYSVVKVNGRNFFAEQGFELHAGDYDEIVRAMKEGFIEPDRAYRLSRDKEGNLFAW